MTDLQNFEMLYLKYFWEDFLLHLNDNTFLNLKFFYQYRIEVFLPTDFLLL